jgi:hypothetical protein
LRSCEPPLIDHATKRALANFGNPFGLALYDRDLKGVRKPRGGDAAKPLRPFILHSASGAEEASFEKPSAFTAALRNTLSRAPSIEALFAIWEQNVDAVRAAHRVLKQEHLAKSGVVPQLVAHLKACAVALANGDAARGGDESRPKIDKSLLTISEPRRVRSKEHLRYVATQPCVICGRTPSHPHHLRHAQPRGLALKVSDEFTVPLCAIHHDEIHRTTRERGSGGKSATLVPSPSRRRCGAREAQVAATLTKAKQSAIARRGGGRRRRGAAALSKIEAFFHTNGARCQANFLTVPSSTASPASRRWSAAAQQSRAS